MFEEYLNRTLALLTSNPLIAAAIGLVVVFLLIKRASDVFKLLGLGVLLVVLFYVVTLLVGTVGSGSKQKDEMIYKTRRAIDD
jgi:hypothetical protein